MRIGIDARFFGPVGKGLGRYTQKLIENLEKIDRTNEYFVFLRKENFDKYKPVNPNFKKVLADYRWYTFSEQINMPAILNKHRLDLVHFPHFNIPLLYRRKFVITIHDLILLHFPTVKNTTINPLFYRFKFTAYKLVIKSAIKRAEKIIAVSNFTKKDILKNYDISASKISVTYEACGTGKKSAVFNELDILLKYGLKDEKHDIIKPYILYVGNAYPHKNLETLILAFRQLNKFENDVHLVLVGKEDYFYRRLKNFALNLDVKNVIFTGYVDDNELRVIYKNSKLYVFVSLYEGFGIPPLEAMNEGVPVISSDHDCMKEILGEAAYYFDAKKPRNISLAIIKVLKDLEIRKKLIERGFKQVKKYSWEKMARETLEIYQK